MKVTRSTEHKPTDTIDVGNVILHVGRRIEICIGYDRGGCIDHEVPHLWKRSVSAPELDAVHAIRHATIRIGGKIKLRFPAVLILVEGKFRLIIITS